MKDLYFKPIILTILCTLGTYGKSSAQAYGDDHNLTLLTPNPTVNTTVQMGIFFTMPNGCYSAQVTPPFSPATLNGFTIDIPVHTYDSGLAPGCPQGIVTISESISLGLLFAGTYTVRLVEYPEGVNPTIVAIRTVTVTGIAPQCPNMPPIQYTWLAPIIADFSNLCQGGCNPTISTALLNGNSVIVVNPGCLTPGGGPNSSTYRCNGQLISNCEPLSGCSPLSLLSLTNFNTIWDCNSGSGPNLTHGSSGNLSFNNGNLIASFSVINNGTAAAGASTVCAYLSTSLSNNQNIFLTPSIPVPAIQAGSSFNVNNHVFDFCNLNIPAGTYYLGFEVDCGNVIAETDESYDDNTGFFDNFTINHSGCGNITITPGTRTVGPLANSCATYTLSSNVSWTLTDNMNWATASPSSGVAGTSTIQVCATSANNSANQRSGMITASGGGATANATFIQSGATLSANPLSFSFPAIGGSATLNITSNTTWALSSLPGWLSVSPSTGSGNGSVTLTCAQNINTSPRSGTLTLAGGGQTVSISINQQAAAPITLTLSPTSLNVGNQAGSATFNITTNCTNWSITNLPGWLSVSPSQGSGNATITVQYQQNTSNQPRSVTLVVSGCSLSQNIVITQAAASITLTLSPGSLNVGDQAGSATFNITTICASWSITNLPGWLSVSPSQGSGNATITVQYQQNTSNQPRSVTLVVSGCSLSQNIVITQAAASITLTLSPGSLNVGDQAGSTTFNITTNCTNWSITNLPGWLSVSPSQGSGNATITVQYQQNTSSQPRSVTLVVSGCSLSQNIVITQAAASITLTLNPGSLNVGDQAGSATFNITTICASWSITNLPGWLSVSPSQGSGNATITVQYQQNTSNQPRSVTLVVSGCSLSQNIVITQAAASITLTLNPGSLNVGDQAGSATFNITTICASWSITNLPGWLSVSPSQGSGNATITVQYQQNTSSQPRSVTLVVSGCSLSQNIVITQAAASITLTLSPGSLNVGDQAGSATFNITTICASWSITNLPGWLSVSPSQGSGNATITVQYQQNTSNQPRSVTLVVSGCSLSQNIVITQAEATPITLTLSPGSLNVGDQAGSATFNITTNCTSWSITNLPGWLSVSPSQGSGNATITVQYQQNTSNQSRSVTLVVSGCALSQNIVITQAAAPITLTLDPSLLNIGGEAGSATFNISTNCSNWSISNPPSWLSLSPSQGSGSATITVQYQQNTGNQPRSITLSVSGCSLSQNMVITQAVQPISYPWSPSITSSNHSVILSGNLDATIDDVPIEAGDLVGFFFEDGGTLHCSNFVVWQGIATGCPVYGNDNPAGMPKNGFESGETFKVKVYRTATSEEFIAEVQYSPIAPPITHTNAYANDGISMITGLSVSTVATLEIPLSAGWNMISSYVMPAEPNIFDVFSAVWDPVTIVKDGQGNFAFPPINQIGDWSMPKGYQVRAEAPTTLTITGAKADPTTTPIAIVPGWQIISYLRDQPGSADEQLASIASQLDVVKNNAGAIYYPSLGINVIGNLLPTQGYKVKANSAATLNYPPNFTGSDPNSWNARNPLLNPTHFVLDTINTGNNATLIFPAGAATSLFQPDDEIGVFTSAGTLCGSVVATTESFAVTVWGDDPATANVQEGMYALEPYTIRIWRAAEQEESILSVVYQQGDGLYQEDDIEIVETIDIINALSPEAADNQMLRVWPNPSGSRFWIQIPAAIEWVRFYNAQGQEIYSLNRPQDGAMQIDLGSVVSGAVFIQAYGKATYRTAVLNINR